MTEAAAHPSASLPGAAAQTPGQPHTRRASERGRLTGIPTIADVLEARKIVAQYLPPTPLHCSESLSRAHNCRVYVKYENHSFIRSFKARGAFYSLSRLTEEERRAGVVTASTGNHGQGMAYAGRTLGIPVTVVLPANTPRLKADAIRSFGADVRAEETAIGKASARADDIARREGKVHVEDGEDGGLMAGAASIAWEIFEDLPDVSTIVVPVGSGNLLAALCLVAKRLNPRIRMIGVQSEAAAAAVESWKAGRIIERRAETFAEGIAAHVPGKLAFDVLRQAVDEMVVVTEAEVRNGIRTVLERTGQIAEGAGAAPFAALTRYGASWEGQNVVLLLSGGNLPVETLRAVLRESAAS
jgi:threonine dehydratase